MTKEERAAWKRVSDALKGAKAITTDGCHKIYVLLDDHQVEEQRQINDENLIPVTDQKQALKTLKMWFAGSCPLRFISAIKTVDGDPNEGFSRLIGQFELS